jgi:hypothetical protein
VVHYAVKNAYSPLLISGYIDATNDDMVNVVVTSDINDGLFVDVNLEVVAWDGGVILSQQTFVAVEMDALDSITVYSNTLTSVLNGLCQADDCFIRLTANTTTTSSSSSSDNEIGDSVEEYSSRSYVFPATFKDSSIPYAAVEASNIQLLDEDDNGLASSASFVLSTNNTAAFVTAETNHTLLPGRFSDNSFVLLPSETQQLTFYASKGVRFTVDDLYSTLTVRNLRANP